MPSLSKPTLKLTPNGDTVNGLVTYTITFSPIERFLSANGLEIRRSVKLFGPDNPPNGEFLATVVDDLLVVPPTGPLTLDAVHEFSMARSTLDENPRIAPYGYTHTIITPFKRLQWVTDYYGYPDYIHALVNASYVGLDLSATAQESEVQMLTGPDLRVLLPSH